MNRPDESIFTPQYWGGLDIRDPAVSADAVAAPEVMLTRKEFSASRKFLKEHLGKIAAGNSTEIAHSASEFNTMMQDGSLLALDQEILLHVPTARYNDLSSADVVIMADVFTGPYAEHWAHSQGTPRAHVVGTQMGFYPEKKLHYVRQFCWGVILSRGATKFMHYLPTNLTRQKPGYISVPSYNSNGGSHRTALQLPFELRNVQVDPPASITDGEIYTFKRIRSLDVVFPVKSRKYPKTKYWDAIRNRLAWPLGIRPEEA